MELPCASSFSSMGDVRSEAASQMQSTLSVLPMAMRVPSGEKAIERIYSLRAFSLSINGDDRFEASHTRSALSWPTVAMRLPDDGNVAFPELESAVGGAGGSPELYSELEAAVGGAAAEELSSELECAEGSSAGGPEPYSESDSPEA